MTPGTAPHQDESSSARWVSTAAVGRGPGCFKTQQHACLHLTSKVDEGALAPLHSVDACIKGQCALYLDGTDSGEVALLHQRADCNGKVTPLLRTEGIANQTIQGGRRHTATIITDGYEHSKIFACDACSGEHVCGWTRPVGVQTTRP